MPGESTIHPQGVTPEKALEYWRSLKPVSDSDYKKLDENARARAFAAAGAATREMAADLHASLLDALDKGESLAAWKKGIAGLLDDLGWKGQRIETVFRTNMQTAYMAGRYAQLMAVAERRPYWQYEAVMDKRTRPDHAVLHGLVYHHEHPFWDSFFPPNGFACRCTVLSLSARQMQREGLAAQKGLPSNLLYTDPHNGMEYHIASPRPDRGFDHNPGKDWLAGLSPRNWGEGAGFTDVSSQPLCPKRGGGNFASPQAPCGGPWLHELPAKNILPVGKGDILPVFDPKGLSARQIEEATSSYLTAFFKVFGIKPYQSTSITLPGVNMPLVISRRLFEDKTAGHGVKLFLGGREQYLPLLARTIKDPYEIWQVVQQYPHKGAWKKVTTLRLIRMFRDEKGPLGGFSVFNLYPGKGWHGTTAYVPEGDTRKVQKMLEYLEGKRKGVLLYRED